MNNDFLVQIQDLFIGFTQTLASIIKIAIFSRFKVLNIEKFKEKEILILGNGPSLKDFIRDRKAYLNNKESICVNFFPCTDEFEKLKPRFFISAAPELWIDNVDSIYLHKRKELFEALEKKTSWPLQLFFPWQAKKSKLLNRCLRNNDHLRIHYFNTTPIEGFTKVNRFLFSLQLGMPRPHNVLIPSLMISIWMGFKKIHIIGADHNWLNEFSVDMNNRVLLRQQHFYDSDSAKYEPMRKMGKGSRKMHEILHKFMLTFKGYHTINDFAKAKNCRIINCTQGSFIDAFERERI